MKNDYLNWIAGILIAFLFVALFVIGKGRSRGGNESVVMEPIVPHVVVTDRRTAIANYKKSADVYVKMMEDGMTELASLSRSRPGKEGEKEWKAQAALCIEKLTAGCRGLVSIKNMPMECRQPHWYIVRAGRRVVLFTHYSLGDVGEISNDQNVTNIAQETKLLMDQIAQFHQSFAELR